MLLGSCTQQYAKRLVEMAFTHHYKNLFKWGFPGRLKMEASFYKHREQHYCAAPYVIQTRTQTLGELGDRRRTARLSRRFSVKFSKERLHFPVEGVTENIGPCGALIKLNDPNAFQIRDRINLILFIPPSFSGQDTTIRLQGSAQIIRLVGDNEGVAVKFTRSLKQFKRTND